MAEKKEQYKMPAVEVGEIVTFYRDANPKDACPAIVQAVGERGLDLGLFVKETYECFPVPHVRHQSDPELRRPETQSPGYWVHGHLRQRLDKLEALIADLYEKQTKPAPKPA